MRLGIAHKLAILLAVVGVVAAGVTGYYGYIESRAAMVAAAESQLLNTTHLIARRVALSREEISRTLLVMANQPAVRAALRGDAVALDQVAEFYRLLMQANPAYFQLRLISAAEHGLERVRVERSAAGVRRIEGDALREKGHHPYVYETLRLPAGHTWLSRITTHQEEGSVMQAGQPVAVLAIPVMDRAGAALGVVVLNIDLKGLFTLLSADLPGHFRLYFANHRGDYLIHPDAARSFGFERGRRYLVQDEFPETKALFRSGAGAGDLVTEARTGEHAEKPLLVAFLRRQVINISSDESSFTLGVSMPYSAATGQADHLAAVVLRLVLALCLACVLVAIVMARAVTRPIKMLQRALAPFDNGRRQVQLPVERQDEIGELARRFERQRLEITRQFEELERSRSELAHLASHDPLTGLPNRSLFADRVAQEISAARRSGDRLGLFFIDLDHFKPINDQLGHEAGDILLQDVARRLTACVRESDTVARLGGDEFVVLLREVQQPEDAAAVADKIREALREPFDLGGHAATITASIGIALFPEHGEEVDALSRHADRAMYQAKEAGRDTVAFAKA